jgi:hypothetical protein
MGSVHLVFKEALASIVEKQLMTDAYRDYIISQGLDYVSFCAMKDEQFERFTSGDEKVPITLGDAIKLRLLRDKLALDPSQSIVTKLIKAPGNSISSRKQNGSQSAGEEDMTAENRSTSIRSRAERVPGKKRKAAKSAASHDLTLADVDGHLVYRTPKRCGHLEKLLGETFCSDVRHNYDRLYDETVKMIERIGDTKLKLLNFDQPKHKKYLNGVCNTVALETNNGRLFARADGEEKEVFWPMSKLLLLTSLIEGFWLTHLVVLRSMIATDPVEYREGFLRANGCTKGVISCSLRDIVAKIVE